MYIDIIIYVCSLSICVYINKHNVYIYVCVCKDINHTHMYK